MVPPVQELPEATLTLPFLQVLAKNVKSRMVKMENIDDNVVMTGTKVNALDERLQDVEKKLRELVVTVHDHQAEPPDPPPLPEIDAFRKELDDMNAFLNKPNQFSNNLFQQDRERVVEGQMFQTPLPRGNERHLPAPEPLQPMAPLSGMPTAQLPRAPMPASPPQSAWPPPGPPPAGLPPASPPMRAQSHRREHERNIFVDGSAAAQGQPCGGCDSSGHSNAQWDSWATCQGFGPRPLWRISRKNTEGLFRFDGTQADFKAWKNRIRDHASEEWPFWREVIDHAAKLPYALTPDFRSSISLYGVNGMHLAWDLWSFLLRWIGPTMYIRRTKLSTDIEGNGLELWRKLSAEYDGNGELVKMAGPARFLDYPSVRISAM